MMLAGGLLVETDSHSIRNGSVVRSELCATAKLQAHLLRAGGAERSAVDVDWLPAVQRVTVLIIRAVRGHHSIRKLEGLAQGLDRPGLMAGHLGNRYSDCPGVLPFLDCLRAC